jgi:hypothetical protein
MLHSTDGLRNCPIITLLWNTAVAKNANADGLSRRYIFQDELKAIYQAALLSAPVASCVSVAAAPHVASEELSVSEAMARIDWPSEQARDPSIAQVVHLISSGSLKGGKNASSDTSCTEIP